MIRPRRSLLFMPGSNARALEKARNLPADGIILDLEDSVAPDAKAVARDQIASAIAAGGFGRREVLIRVNALDSPWWIDDVTMAGKAKPDGILVPKISSVQDLSAIADRLSDIGAPMSIRVWAMIETARAVLHAEELAAASRDSEMRLAGFVFGPNDISRETRIRMQPGRLAMLPMITHCILATRLHGLEILDGPYSDFSNVDGFAQECAQGRDLGFDGKTLIHPGQIDALQRDLHAASRGSRAGAKNHRGVRAAGKCRARCYSTRRPDGGETACGHGKTYHRDCGCDRRNCELTGRRCALP
jgi:citrate lyase subunit beta/citryl-CoA lyase